MAILRWAYPTLEIYPATTCKCAHSKKRIGIDTLYLMPAFSSKITIPCAQNGPHAAATRRDSANRHLVRGTHLWFGTFALQAKHSPPPGCLLVIFVATVCINLTVASNNPHNRVRFPPRALRFAFLNPFEVMFGVSVVLFVIATMHLAMNLYRLIRGFIIFRDAPGGPAAYLGVLEYWDHIFKDTLYATQSIFGDAAAVYRCWILWNSNWQIVVLPFLLLMGSTVSGYMVCGLYTTVDPSATVFNPRLANWITTFYSIAVAQNIMTTSLMAYRLWSVDARSAAYRIHRSPFIHVLRILVESAALYLFVEILLLSLYSVNLNAQYILLELVTPIVVRPSPFQILCLHQVLKFVAQGITFNVITIRINPRSFEERKEATGVSVAGSHPVQTVGSLPMRRLVIRRDVEAITVADADEPGIYSNHKPSGDVKTGSAV
uniref:Uncharacterized protein n=1 Tax=Mycena chlorophos TaxID=658473 RepID=A0ABQ0M099_MYCCL|nr:predicted protein [Mycena chlorophos]